MLNFTNKSIILENNVLSLQCFLNYSHKKMKVFNKKNSIWLIIFLMAVTFSLLISLQFGYVIRTKNIIHKQYSDAVQRSLYRTVKSIEEAERIVNYEDIRSSDIL